MNAWGRNTASLSSMGTKEKLLEVPIAHELTGALCEPYTDMVSPN
jgi:hypothetical protein